MEPRQVRILIGLGATIVALLVAIIVTLLVKDGGGEPVAATTATVTDTTQGTSAPATLPPSTEATSAPTAPETTQTVPPMSAADVAAAPDGLHSLRDGSALWIGDDPDAAIASGWVDYPGPDFTIESEGFLCGFGTSTGIFGPDAFQAMFMEPGIVRIYIWTPDLRTEEGLGVGSTRAEVEGVMGVPDEETPGHYVPTETELYYQFGDVGFLFVVDGDVVIHMSVGLWEALHFVEGCL